MVAYVFNPGIQEAETSGFPVSSRLTQYTQ